MSAMKQVSSFHIREVQAADHISVLDAILSIIPDRPDKPRLKVLEQFRNLGASNSANPSTQSRNLLSNITGLSRMLMDELEQCCITGESFNGP